MPTLGDYQDVVQINMDNFRHAVVNLDKSITIGGGARMEDIIPTLHAAGREMSTCSIHPIPDHPFAALEAKRTSSCQRLDPSLALESSA